MRQVLQRRGPSRNAFTATLTGCHLSGHLGVWAGFPSQNHTRTTTAGPLRPNLRVFGWAKSADQDALSASVMKTDIFFNLCHLFKTFYLTTSPLSVLLEEVWAFCHSLHLVFVTVSGKDETDEWIKMENQSGGWTADPGGSLARIPIMQKTFQMHQWHEI